MKRPTIISALHRVLPATLALTGTMLVAIGIGMIYPPAGWISLGLGAWLLEWRYDSATEAGR